MAERQSLAELLQSTREVADLLAEALDGEGACSENRRQPIDRFVELVRAAREKLSWAESERRE